MKEEKKIQTINSMRKTVIWLSLAGIFDTAYLTYYKFSSTAELICGESQGCDYVNNSPYSEILGIPVALLGLFYYAAVLALTINGRKSTVFFLSSAALLFTFYLTYVEVYILNALCFWCIISALLTLSIFVLSTPKKRWHESEDSPAFLAGK